MGEEEGRKDIRSEGRSLGKEVRLEEKGKRGWRLWEAPGSDRGEELSS